MRYRYQWGDTVYEIAIERDEDGYRALVNGQSYKVELLDAQAGQISLRFQDRPLILYWASQGDQKWISANGCAYLLQKPSARRAGHAGDTAEEDSVRAPMPAQVRSLQIQEGDRVEKGQTLMILEAMKMEIRVRAPHAGHLVRLLITEGQTVDRGQILAEVSSNVDKNMISTHPTSSPAS